MQGKQGLIDLILSKSPKMELWNDLEQLKVGYTISGLYEDFIWKVDVLKAMTFNELSKVIEILSSRFITIDIFITVLLLENGTKVIRETVGDFDRSVKVGDASIYGIPNDKGFKVIDITYIKSNENIYRDKITIKNRWEG